MGTALRRDASATASVPGITLERRVALVSASDSRVPLALPVSMRFQSFRRGRGRQNNIQSRAVTVFGVSFPEMYWQSQWHPADDHRVRRRPTIHPRPPVPSAVRRRRFRATRVSRDASAAGPERWERVVRRCCPARCLTARGSRDEWLRSLRYRGGGNRGRFRE
jgi:hypothetical protein